jgi:acetylornithine deacetylase
MAELADILPILEDLVAIPSLPGECNEAWLTYVSSRLSAAGVRVMRVPSPDQTCTGLLASVGPDVAGGLVLSGHFDVVSVNGQDWTGDPFRLRQDGTRLIGRGAVDMKGFLACAIAVLEEAARQKLSRPVYLVISADEETACQSARTLADKIAKTQPPPRGVLVGEPTLLRAVNGHKGSYTYQVDVTGRTAHASTPEMGANAVTLAARLVAWLDDRSASSSAAGGSVHSVGRIDGGNASNIIAQHCRFEWDLRLAPSDDLHAVTRSFTEEADRLCAPLRANAPEVAVTLAQVASFPGFQMAPDAPFACECLGISQSRDYAELTAGTEAGLFQAAGFPVMVMGPGDMAQAHTADEFVHCDQLQGCLSQLRQMVFGAADAH